MRPDWRSGARLSCSISAPPAVPVQVVSWASQARLYTEGHRQRTGSVWMPVLFSSITDALNARIHACIIPVHLPVVETAVGSISAATAQLREAIQCAVVVRCPRPCCSATPLEIVSTLSMLLMDGVEVDGVVNFASESVSL